MLSGVRPRNCHLIKMLFVILQLWLVSNTVLVDGKVDLAKDAELPRDCGKNAVKRIVGGEQAKPHSWPWQVAVYEQPSWSTDENGYNFICGASIINQRYVLCAAHCVSSYGEVTKPKKLKLLLGGHNRTSGDGQWYKVNKILLPTYPKYNDSTMQHDISLFRLETPIDFSKTNKTIAPICIADAVYNKENLAGVNSVVTGWGSLEPMGDVSDVLMQVSVPIVSQEKCIKAYDKESITKLNICAGFDQGKKDSCQGDSGGPICIRRNNCWTQVGIVSWGRSCAEPDAYGVYTRVSQQYSWIIKQLAKERKTSLVTQQVID